MQADKILVLVNKALEDLKGVDIRVLNVEALTTITSHMVFCTGTSQRHVKSLADNVIHECKHADQPPMGVEGIDQAEWVLVDLGEVVVHIMQAQTRALFQLEKLWAASSAESSAEVSGKSEQTAK